MRYVPKRAIVHAIQWSGARTKAVDDFFNQHKLRFPKEGMEVGSYIVVNDKGLASKLPKSEFEAQYKSIDSSNQVIQGVWAAELQARITKNCTIIGNGIISIEW